MVKLIRDGMGLDLRVRVALVNHGGPDRAPAWIGYPDPFPRNGTPEFKRTVVTVFLRKAFLLKYKFEHVVMAIAHELSHVVLFRIGHPLEEVEEAVDLTAMLLGYSEFYFNGLRLLHTERLGRLGYLTGDEIQYAAGVLGRPIEKPANSVRIQKRFVPTLSGIHAVAFAFLVAIGLVLASSRLFNHAAVEELDVPLATVPRGFTGLPPPEWVTPMSKSPALTLPVPSKRRPSNDLDDMAYRK